MISIFFDNQPIELQTEYKNMLETIGVMSRFNTDSDTPYLYYRTHERIFCKVFNASDQGRDDSAIDAHIGEIGIGLKTFIGGNNQKVAEFNSLLSTFQNLSGLELVQKIAEYRNTRIEVAISMYGLDSLIYHVVKRTPGKMHIYECGYDTIDINNITLVPCDNPATNPYFTDGKHTYHFNRSKSTLYMLFDDMVLLDSFDVGICEDILSRLPEIRNILISSLDEQPGQVVEPEDNRPRLCLRLYSSNNTRGKFVGEKSGLNEWNAAGRPRDPNEIYIPYPAVDRKRSPGFFPPIDTPFILNLPDGTIMPAKVCQQDGKAIMSNPNKTLGKWLLRDVFKLPEGTVLTYNALQRFGIDSVIFTKNDDATYSVDFSSLGTYEKFYHLDDSLEDDEEETAEDII